MPKRVAVAVLLTALGAATACSGTHDTAEPTPPTIAPTTTDAYAPTSPPDPVSGFGATTAVWDASHTEDTRYPPGSSFDPHAGLAGGATDEYVAVHADGGRITKFTRNFEREASTMARAEALDALPSDARLMWQTSATGCYKTAYVSHLLAEYLRSSTFGDPAGEVEIYFYSSPTADVYSSADTESAVFRLGTASTATDAPGC